MVQGEQCTFMYLCTLPTHEVMTNLTESKGVKHLASSQTFRAEQFLAGFELLLGFLLIPLLSGEIPSH